MIGKRGPSAARRPAMTSFDRRASGAPDRPPLSPAFAWPATPSRASVVLVAMTPSIAMARDDRRDRFDLRRVEIGSDLDEHRHVPAVLVGELGAARRERGEQGVEGGVRLQRAQVLRVRARDVDGDVVGMRIDAGEADQVVVGGALDRRRRVLADVQAEDAAAGAKARLPDVGDERGQAVVVEAEPVDQRAGLGDAEHARLRIARLRQRRHRADLDEAEAHRAEGVDAAAVLVEPGGQADAVRKRQPGDRHRVVHARLLDERDQRRALDRRQRRQRQVVRVLRIEPEQKRSGQREGNERHDGRRFWHRRAYFAAGPRHGRAAHRERHLRRHRRRRRSPVGRADRAVAAPLRHLDREDAGRADPRARLGQAQRRRRQPRPRHAAGREGRRDRRRRRRGPRRPARRRVPALGLADRLGHADQHEHERGARQPRLATARRAASAKAGWCIPTTTSTAASRRTTSSRRR